MDNDQSVKIELLGVARLLTRRETATIPLAAPVPLSEFLSLLALELPALVGTTLSEDGSLLGGYVLSRNGADLIRDPAESIHPGDRLLLLSLSAGGSD
jgi:hypothetical protein